MRILYVILITVGLGFPWWAITREAWKNFKALRNPDLRGVYYRGLKQISIIALLLIFWYVYCFIWLELVREQTGYFTSNFTL